MLTSSLDGTVKLWNFNNGQVIRNFLSFNNVSIISIGVWGFTWYDNKLVCAVSNNATDRMRDKTLQDAYRLIMLDFNKSLPSDYEKRLTC